MKTAEENQQFSPEVTNFFDDIDNTLNNGIDRQHSKEIPNKEEDPAKNETEEPEPKKVEESGNEILFERKPKKKATEEESIAVLRRQRDEERERLKAFQETLGEVPPEAIAPILEYVKEVNAGIVDPKSFAQVVESFKKKDEEINALKEELGSLSGTVKDLDIKSSREFQEGYYKPYEESAKTLIASFATVSDNKIIGQKSAREFHDFLMTNPDGISVKQAYKKYAQNFKAETGEDPDPLDMVSIMSSVRDFASKRTSMEKAYTDWEEQKKRKQQDLTVEEQRRQEEVNLANRKVRVTQTQKAYNDFDFDSIEGLLSEDDVKEAFREDHKFSEEGLFSSDPTKVPSYDALVLRGVKSRLYDRMLPKFKELMEAKAELEQIKNSGLKGAKSFTPKSGDSEKIDWLTGLPKR